MERLQGPHQRARRNRGLVTAHDGRAAEKPCGIFTIRGSSKPETVENGI